VYILIPIERDQAPLLGTLAREGTVIATRPQLQKDGIMARWRSTKLTIAYLSLPATPENRSLSTRFVRRSSVETVQALWQTTRQVWERALAVTE
jgi:hypothetical protein